MKSNWAIFCFTIFVIAEIVNQSILAEDQFDCGIVGLDGSFFFQEVSENTTKDTVIHTRQTKNVVDASIEENDYIRIQFDVNFQELNFTVEGDLSSYRAEEWNPVLETVLMFTCKNLERTGTADETPLQRNFTFLTVIADENLNAPEFDFPTYRIFTPEDPILNIATLDKWPIVITDLDYNNNHADVQIMCAETTAINDCHIVHLELCNASYTGNNVKGHKYNVLIKLKEGQQFDKELNFKIISFDGMDDHTRSANVTVQRATPTADDWDFPFIEVSSGAGVLILLLCGWLGFFAYKKRKVETTLRKLTEAEIREFEHGTANISTVSKRSVDVNASILFQPYKREFDIPRENLRIDETSVLGTGAFGIVMKGTVIRGRSNNITVAVKTVKRNVGVLYFKALLSELKIMAYIGSHHNVVSLIGACTHNIRKRELYIAVEYCANGNFHHYLKCRKDAFLNCVSDGKLDGRVQYSAIGRKNSFSKTVSTFDLLRWSHQIASGMEFLESKAVIHGDLAARNVLLDESRIAKIADFGLSRRIVDYHNNYYHTKTSANTPLPWKWMAPESLKYMKFSHKSDIWSFGVVLWECFTLGQSPYPGLQWSEDFIGRLENGLRMPKPDFAFDDMYNMIIDCWDTDPFHRPSIGDLKIQLDQMLNVLLRQQGGGYLPLQGELPTVSLLAESADGYLLPNSAVEVQYC